MSGRVPWLRVFLEGIVIGVGVLGALGAEAWWAGRQDRVRERQYLVALREDFLATEVQFDAVLTSARNGMDHSKALLRLLDSPAESVPLDSLESMVRTAFIGYWFAPQRAAYTDLVNSGALGLIRDDSLRTAMAEFEASLESVRILSDLILDHWTAEVSPFQSRHLNLTRVYGQDAVVQLGGFTVPAIELGPPVAHVSSDHRVFWSREFINLLARKLDHDEGLVRYGEQSLAEVRRVLDLIERSLAS